MPSIAVDSGPLIALFDRDDRHHAAASAFIASTTEPMITNLAVITEAAFLLRFSAETVGEFLGWAAQALVIDKETPEDFPRIAFLMIKYADLPADFADASLIALCERRGVTSVATVDGDFTLPDARPQSATKCVSDLSVYPGIPIPGLPLAPRPKFLAGTDMRLTHWLQQEAGRTLRAAGMHASKQNSRCLEFNPNAVVVIPATPGFSPTVLVVVILVPLPIVLVNADLVLGPIFVCFGCPPAIAILVAHDSR